MKIAGMTPREFAHDIALDWIRAAYEQKTGDLGSLSDAETRAVKASLAKLHDHILARSGLDGLPLSETV